MSEREILIEKLEKAVTYARKHKNTIAEENFCSIMGDLVKEPAKRGLIEAYLKEKHIRVILPQEEKEEEIVFDMSLDDEDRRAIDFYYEELKNLPYLTDREKERITAAALEGEQEAQTKLINIFLPQVVELARMYTGHDIPLEDLIGEGNIALMIGVTMLESVESAEEVEGFLGKVIIDSLEKLVTDEDAEEKLIIKLGERLKKDIPEEKEENELQNIFPYEEEQQ